MFNLCCVQGEVVIPCLQLVKRIKNTPSTWDSTLHIKHPEMGNDIITTCKVPLTGHHERSIGLMKAACDGLLSSIRPLRNSSFITLTHPSLCWQSSLRSSRCHRLRGLGGSPARMPRLCGFCHDLEKECKSRKQWVTDSGFFLHREFKGSCLSQITCCHDKTQFLQPWTVLLFRSVEICNFTAISTTSTSLWWDAVSLSLLLQTDDLYFLLDEREHCVFHFKTLSSHFW